MKLSEDEIAKEVGFSPHTFQRAKVIEESDLPEIIKKAAFDGRLSIRPVADLVTEPEEIKKEVVKEATKRLKNGDDRFSIESLALKEKQKQEIERAMGGCLDEPDANQTIERFLTDYKEALKKMPKDATKSDDLQITVNFFKKLLTQKKVTCPICGEEHLQWKCGHAF